MPFSPTAPVPVRVAGASLSLFVALVTSVAGCSKSEKADPAPVGPATAAAAASSATSATTAAAPDAPGSGSAAKITSTCLHKDTKVCRELTTTLPGEAEGSCPASKDTVLTKSDVPCATVNAVGSCRTILDNTVWYKGGAVDADGLKRLCETMKGTWTALAPAEASKGGTAKSASPKKAGAK